MLERIEAMKRARARGLLPYNLLVLPRYKKYSFMFGELKES